LLVFTSISLAQCVSLAEAYWNTRGDPNEVGYARDRGMSWQGWHHISGIPQWVTAWAFVALFIGIVAVFIKCGKEDFNMYPRDCLGYLKALFFGLLCALPCLWPPLCIYFHCVKKRNRERTGQEQGQETVLVWNREDGTWNERPRIVNNSTVPETDPEALPDYPDHPQTTLPDYPSQPILPYNPEQTTLPDYSDSLLPSAPPAEFATVSAAEIAAEEAAAAADAREAAEAAAALAAAEAAVAAAARSGQNEYEAPPSYDAAMRDEV